jgi:hypothetical protein
MTGSFIKSGYSGKKANLSTNRELIPLEETTIYELFTDVMFCV